MPFCGLNVHLYEIHPIQPEFFNNAIDREHWNGAAIVGVCIASDETVPTGVVAVNYRCKIAVLVPYTFLQNDDTSGGDLRGKIPPQAFGGGWARFNGNYQPCAKPKCIAAVRAYICAAIEHYIAPFYGNIVVFIDLAPLLGKNNREPFAVGFRRCPVRASGVRQSLKPELSVSSRRHNGTS